MIILVAGLPGSGKSYFATRLAAHLNAVYISSDKVRNLFDGMGRYTFQDKLSVYKGMADLAEVSVVKGETVVLDATFFLRDMRTLFYTLAAKHSLDLYFIYIEAVEELIKKRVAKKRPDSEADFEVYMKIKGEYESIDSPHLVLRSTDDNITEMIQKALTYIKKV